MKNLFYISVDLIKNLNRMHSVNSNLYKKNSHSSFSALQFYIYFWEIVDPIDMGQDICKNVLAFKD